jgi:hypothetical protein
MLTPPTEHQSTLHHHTVSWTREVAAGAPRVVPGRSAGGAVVVRYLARRASDKKRGRDGAKYSKFHPRGYLSHHLAAISMAVYTDAAHIADGVIGLKQRSLVASDPTE